jgi:hypothetical protein
MPLIEIKWKPTAREVRQFSGLLGIVAGAAGAWLALRSDAWAIASVVWTVGGAVALAGLAAPRAVRPVMVGWMVAAYPIGWAFSWLVLLITFYGIFLPVALLMRAFRYDPLDRRIDRAARSYWVDRGPARDPASYFRQF